MAEESYFVKLLRDLEATIDQNDLSNTNHDPQIKDKLHEVMYMLIAVFIQAEPIAEIVEKCVFESEEIIREFDEQNPYIEKAAPYFHHLRDLRNVVCKNYPNLI
ncbi:MAG: hypothetical protein HY959_03655 [Ignavibacteriae bacterium]|nr:hypothetical protein [Ignavibacteriota bacterium]